MAVSVGSFVHEEEETDHPVRYLPIRHLYSNTSPPITTSGSSNVMSKKVKARKLTEEVAVEEEGKKKPIAVGDPGPEEPCKTPQKKPVQVYRRRGKRPRHSPDNPSFYDSLVREMESASRSSGNPGGEEEEEGGKGGGDGGGRAGKKRKRLMKYELLGLGAGSGFACGFGRTRTRVSRAANQNGVSDRARKNVPKGDASKEDSSASATAKRWVELSYDGIDPLAFVGLTCKVFWPMDEDWFTGSITGYSLETEQHRVEYNDGDVEDLCLTHEGIKFYISCQEMQCLNLKHGREKKMPSHDEILALAASCNACQDLEPGDLVWAKLTGHARWPAVVINGAHLGAHNVLKPIRGEKAIHVQFFGTHDFARISRKQAVPYLNGLLSFYHQKCKQRHFQRSVEEAIMYLWKEKLPNNMLRLQKGVDGDERLDSGEDPSHDEGREKAVECIKTCPFEIGDLRVTNLGKIVCDSQFFHNKSYIWPEGYTAFRKFISITDPNSSSCYKMEVLRNPKSKARPLFRVTLEGGERIEGPKPTVCWKEIYSRICTNLYNGCHAKVEECKLLNSGSYMFGFSNPKISQLIQGLPNSSLCLKYTGSSSDLAVGYQPVNIGPLDLDRCNVCGMDEEYDGNLFLQCDKCRILVHARCYGELEPLNGLVWLCNLCRPGAPKSLPQCCLCPVIGGAIKPTTDGRWAHLTCAMWIPETCLLDVKKMEPIDGLRRINKNRWKLLCSICDVPYGACIQCCSENCRVAYHPLCARSIGLCFELADEDLHHLMSMDEDDGRCIHLLSFCKKHKQPSHECPPADEKLISPSLHCSTYVPPSNPSGCARSEPYNFFGRRGQREPQVLAAASVKRLFVENRPYLVSGCCQIGLDCNPSCIESGGKNSYSIAPKLESPQDVASGHISSMTEKYTNMKATFRKRLAFGKSRIHGFGVFAKLAHKAGDMVIEYSGELVRPPIADMREHLIYNSLVGAGTYMFRIDNERVIDATRAGSIAHLINHSCEPNCYSRGISVDGDEHIIIFAKRDIKQWEELTYDYRFFSIDEQLACYCGFPRCCGIVNDVEAEEQVAKIWAPRLELIPWKGE